MIEVWVENETLVEIAKYLIVTTGVSNDDFNTAERETTLRKCAAVKQGGFKLSKIDTSMT